jgi:hypothetical protein
MTRIVIGSTALHSLYPEQVRKPKDLDTFNDEHGSITNPEDSFWDDRLLEWFGPSESGYADRDELYTIKVSHAQWDLKNGSWGKHMADILFLQGKGAKLIPELHDILYRIWIDRHGPKKMTFSESEEFFDDAVVRKYDHDSLHESVAYGDHALYLDYLIPGKSVAMDMGKVWASGHDTLVKLFREEIYATALERIVIPRSYRVSPGYAYHWALRRTITSLTKGRTSRWLIENFKDFKEASDPYTIENYVERHQRKGPYTLIPLEGK